MTFQVSKYKERNFLELNNNDNQPIYLTYSKSSIWIRHFGFSTSICTCVTRMITNHTPIGEYRLRFFSKEFFACLCEDYSIKTRRYIMFYCAKYKKSWNPKRKSLKNVLIFLEFNPSAFCF